MKWMKHKRKRPPDALQLHALDKFARLIVEGLRCRGAMGVLHGQVAFIVGVVLAPRSAATKCAPFRSQHTMGTPLLVSEWERLSDEDLPKYFTGAEQLGITRRTCGPATHKGKKRWISGTSKYSSDYKPARTYNSPHTGPCCPNGHTYGWFGQEPNTTDALRLVEVVGGVRTKPFRIHRLFHFLKKLCPPNTTIGKGVVHRPALNDKIVVWLHGDSTSKQFYFALFCGLVRIGATVESCTISGGHYQHPNCAHKRTAAETALYQDIAVLTLDGFTIELFLICDCQSSVPIAQACEANGTHCPTLFLVNFGLHFRLSRLDTVMVDRVRSFYEYPERVRSRIIWRETVVQHFPGGGLYEDYTPANYTHCVERVNISDLKRALVRQHTIHRAVVQEAAKKKLHPFPYLSLEGLELNAGATYSTAWYNAKKFHTDLDCTHHLYSPLYWDAVFDRLADMLSGFIDY